MAMKARYTVVDGEVVAEKRGGLRKCYVPDPLGSTVALLDNSQTITDTWTYWPYGEVKTRTGTTATPFQFVGTLGYYKDSGSRDYVRARYLRKDLTRWQTEDSISDQDATQTKYVYAASRPTYFTDESGRDPIDPPDLGKKFVSCLTKCAGQKGKAWASCMMGCLGGLAWNYCSYIACLADPRLCPHGCDPCSKKKCNYQTSLCDCCEVTWYCCMAQTKDNVGVQKCNKDQTNCEMQNGCATVNIGCDVWQ